MENPNSFKIFSGFFCIFVFLDIWSFSEATLKIHSSVLTKNEEHVRLSFIRDPTTKRKKRSEDDRQGTNLLPNALTINFTLGYQPITLYLIRNKKMDNIKIPIHTAHHNDSMLLDHLSALKHVGAYYQSPNSTANIHLECNSNTTSVCTNYQVFGTFDLNNTLHIIEPYIQPIDLGNVDQIHRIVETLPTEPFRIDTLPLPANSKAENIKTTPRKKNSRKVRHVKKPKRQNKKRRLRLKKQRQKNKSKTDKPHPRRKRASGSYLIEVYVVVDYEIYNFWLQEENYDDSRAIQRIRQYYSFLFNGIDSRYRHISSSYRIEVAMIGLYIAKSRTDLSFINDHASCFGSSPCKLNSNGAIRDVKAWVQRKGLPQYDHIMIFTRHDMVTASLDTSGTAYLNSICTSRSHSIVEEKFDFIAATVGAHEIGHTLGAVHDGENNACSVEPHYIMVSVSSAMRRPYQRSPWEFSRCSVREFGVFLDDVEMNNRRTCMQSRNPNAGSYGTSSLRKPGQIFDVDQQCELIVGKGSYACRSLIGNGNYEDVCTGLWCKTSGSFSSSNCILALPVEGTTCGNNKLCNGFRCQYDPSAPTFTDGCIFKDIPGTILKQLTCSELIRREPYQCYSQSIRKNCCRSCSRIKSNDPGCLYGDKSLDCADVARRNECNLYRNICCRTCR